MTRSLSKAVALLLLAAIVASGCASARNNPKTTTGGMLGAAGGGLIAAAAGGGAVGIVGGVLIGALVGGAIGNHLDQKDKELAMKNAQNTFENAKTGQSSSWSNPDSGNAGHITPTKTFQTSTGQYCREYQQEIMIGGEPHKSYGTACRQPDGSWKIQG